MSNTAKSYEERATSAPTELHKRFAEWLEIETGVKVDLKTVQLVCSMRHDYQKSEANQSHLQERKQKAAADKKARAAAKKLKLEAQLAKLQGELAAVETPAAAPVVPASTPAPEKKTPTPRKPRVRKTAAPKPNTLAVKNAPAPVAEDFDQVDLDEPVKPVARRTRRATAAK